MQRHEPSSPSLQQCEPVFPLEGGQPVFAGECLEAMASGRLQFRRHVPDVGQPAKPLDGSLEAVPVFDKQRLYRTPSRGSRAASHGLHKRVLGAAWPPAQPLLLHGQPQLGWRRVSRAYAEVAQTCRGPSFQLVRSRL